MIGKIRSIFYDDEIFKRKDSLNETAGIQYFEEQERFMEECGKVARDSYQYFQKLPQECPYRFDQLVQIPQEVEQILNSEESQLEKEQKIIKLIKNEI